MATQIDPASERIIKYLSDTYGVRINAATFQYFSDGESGEYLARVFLLKPSQVELKAQSGTTSKRRPNLSPEQLAAYAEENEVASLYKRLSSSLERYFKKGTTLSSLGFQASFKGGGRRFVSGRDPDISGFEGYFSLDEDVQRFLSGVNQLDANIKRSGAISGDIPKKDA